MIIETTSVEQERRIRLSRGIVRVLTTGAGPALVYLHGVGDVGDLLAPLRQLSSRYAVLRPDHPGFLESEDCGVRSVADIAEIHRELLDALGVESFTLIGCSLGGWVAVELALLLPERITELILIDPAGLAGPQPAPDIFAMSPEERLRATIADPVRRQAAVAASVPEETGQRLARNQKAAHRLAANPYMHDPSLPGRAADLQLPAHIVWGADDGVIPVSFAASWTRMWPHARLTVIPEAGHLPHVEKTAEFLTETGLTEERS